MGVAVAAECPYPVYPPPNVYRPHTVQKPEHAGAIYPVVAMLCGTGDQHIEVGCNPEKLPVSHSRAQFIDRTIYKLEYHMKHLVRKTLDRGVPGLGRLPLKNLRGLQWTPEPFPMPDLVPPEVIQGGVNDAGYFCFGCWQYRLEKAWVDVGGLLHEGGESWDNPRFASQARWVGLDLSTQRHHSCTIAVALLSPLEAKATHALDWAYATSRQPTLPPTGRVSCGPSGACISRWTCLPSLSHKGFRCEEGEMVQ